MDCLVKSWLKGSERLPIADFGLGNSFDVAAKMQPGEIDVIFHSAPIAASTLRFDRQKDPQEGWRASAKNTQKKLLVISLGDTHQNSTSDFYAIIKFDGLKRKPLESGLNYALRRF